jgi:mannosyltransferase OCH1-like enzyme
MKYFLTLVSVFKNEAMILEEWINHYIKEGVEHFYLVNNGSDDNFMDIIDKYSNIITLVNDNYRQEKHTLVYLMNKHFLNKIKLEADWVITCDIDEYMYNKHNYKTIKHFLNNKGQVKNDIGTIWIPWKLFYASKNDCIENSIISEVLERRPRLPDRDYGDGKSIYRVRDLNQLQLHHGSNPYNFKLNKEINNNKKDINNNKTLILNIDSNLYCNHYRFISKEYYEKIKCVRLGQNSKQNFIYTMEYFNKINNNNKEERLIDTTLKNKKYYIDTLIQTYHEIDDIVKESRDSFLSHNPKLKYDFYDDKNCEDFILKHFDNSLLSVYHKLKPKAFKADLFRYCYLYINGGIYSDIDTICLENIDKLLDLSNDVVLVNERSNIPGFFQAFIIAKPRQTIFINAINKIRYNVNNNYYGSGNYRKDHINNILSITGPVLLGNTLCNMLKKSEFTYVPNQDNIKLDNCNIKLLTFTKDGFIKENNNNINIIKAKNNNYKSDDDYKKLFINRTIYE